MAHVRVEEQGFERTPKRRELVITSSRIPGIAFLYLEIVEEFRFSRVSLEERFLYRQVHPNEYTVCFAASQGSGYNDVVEEPKEFEGQLVEKLKDLIDWRAIKVFVLTWLMLELN